jgi:hypothetical protein
MPVGTFSRAKLPLALARRHSSASSAVAAATYTIAPFDGAWQTSIRSAEGKLCAVVTQTQLVLD